MSCAVPNRKKGGGSSYGRRGPSHTAAGVVLHHRAAPRWTGTAMPNGPAGGLFAGDLLPVILAVDEAGVCVGCVVCIYKGE